MSVTTAKNKRPLGFYVCSMAFTLERMAYYSAKFLIFMFVAATIATGGLGLTKAEAAIIQSNLVAFTYLAPVFGGYIADRYVGARYCIPVGLLLMSGGYYVGSMATGAAGMNLMVALVAIGTGLFKGNASAITGRLFNNKEQLDSAFSTQYSFVNAGAFIGTTLVGILYTGAFAKGEILGFRACFQMSALICIIAAIWFIFGSKFMGETGKKPFKAGEVKEVKTEVANKPLSKGEKKRVFAIVLVSMFSIVFWVFWYLTYLAAYDFGEYFINMNVNGFDVPLSWFDSLNSFACMALGPILGMLWYRLSKRPQGDLSLFKKLALGLAFLGSAFLMLVFAEISRGIGAPETAKASLMYLFAFGLLLTIGEMCFSPLGNSFVTKYAPAKLLGVLMGVWTFATFVAGKTYGYLYAITSSYSPIQAYTVVPAVLFVCAVILFFGDKKLTSLLEGDEEENLQEALEA
ncbi:MAG: peptide MFS transporter [Clostridia bacterium]|nr:peptide MFS transporter [Clostridia bacterium]